MKSRKNDCEVKTLIDEQTYLHARKLAELREQTLSGVLRQAIRTYIYGCSLELNLLVPALSREKVGDPREKPR